MNIVPYNMIWNMTKQISILISCLLLGAIQSIGQGDIPVPQRPKHKKNHELGFGVNRTYIEQESTFDGDGFILSYHRPRVNEKMVSFTGGIEFKKTSIFVKTIQESRSVSYSDAHLDFYYFSLPALLRFKFGEYERLNVQLGPYLDILGGGVLKGRQKITPPMTLQQPTTESDVSIGISSSNIKFGGVIDIIYRPFLRLPDVGVVTGVRHGYGGLWTHIYSKNRFYFAGVSYML